MNNLRVLHNWYLMGEIQGKMYIHGETVRANENGEHKFIGYNTPVNTIDFKNGIVDTTNEVFKLGKMRNG